MTSMEPPNTHIDYIYQYQKLILDYSEKDNRDDNENRNDEKKEDTISYRWQESYFHALSRVVRSIKAILRIKDDFYTNIFYNWKSMERILQTYNPNDTLKSSDEIQTFGDAFEHNDLRRAVNDDANILSERLNDVLAHRECPIATVFLSAVMMAKEYGYSPSSCNEIYYKIINSFANIRSD